MNRTLHLACAADANYIPHCAVVARSAIASQTGAVCLHFLHAQDLAPELCEALAADVRAAGGQFRSHAIASEKVAALAVMDRIPAVMWFRIFLPELLPELDRILYLDCDTLVVSALDELWECSLGGALLGAVENIPEPGSIRRQDQLGIAQAQGYFNSGVLLMNLAAWRAHGTTQQLLEFARQRGEELIWPDQDALNVIAGPRRMRLHPRWNCQNSMYYFPQTAEGLSQDELAAATDSPAIVHFEGPGFCKPWHVLCKHPYSETYRQFRRESAWHEFALEGERSMLNQLIRWLPMRWIAAVLRLQWQLKPARLRRWLGRRLRSRAMA